MSTYTQLLYQLVFSTKNHDKTLIEGRRKEIYKYIYGILQNKKCHLYRIGGVEDHIHIITHIHPSVALSHLIKDVKLSTSVFIKQQDLFPDFTGWQDGYSAFTYSIQSKDFLIEYVKNQKEHHRTKTFTEELIELFNEHQIQYNAKYLI